MPAIRSKKPRTTAPRRVLNARPDTLDFRDKMYQATLRKPGARVARRSTQERPLHDYKWRFPNTLKFGGAFLCL